MKTIKDYLDSLFLTIPVTSATKQAKAELLEIMEDHYHELIQEGKSENEAIGEVISEFGSIDEILSALEIDPEDNEERLEEGESIEKEEVYDFWADTRKFAFELSSGIFLLFFSIALMCLIDYGPFFTFIAIFGFFIALALGIGLIISTSIKYNRKMKRLVNRPLDSMTQKEAHNEWLNYEKSFTTGLVCGIGALVLSIPLMIFFMEYFLLEALGVSVFLTSIGAGCFLIIYVSIIRHGFKRFTISKNSFDKRREEKEKRTHGKRRNSRSPLEIIIRNFYWPMVLILYFLWSFITFHWAYSWVIFPLAALLQKTIVEILDNENK
ncbi:MAG TPA: beta-carotene 15,15'-monooxygenase [Candidatus Tetragenococcus pullicola]|nr:beta-carotene 15,15'-monooxygenase [Candidatus Tetragenococcus pullicola]